MSEPKLIIGGSFTDDRGDMEYFNDIEKLKIDENEDFDPVLLSFQYSRMYFVSNHQTNFVRAWHGHMHEGLLVKVVAGVALIGAAKLEKIGREIEVSPDNMKQYVLCGSKGQMLYIPPGWANGAKTLKANTKIMYIADHFIDPEDDYRFDYNIIPRFWEVRQR